MCFCCFGVMFFYSLCKVCEWYGFGLMMWISLIWLVWMWVLVVLMIVCIEVGEFVVNLVKLLLVVCVILVVVLVFRNLVMVGVSSVFSSVVVW